MKKIYYLKTCDTCKRILKQLKETIGKANFDTFELQEIKSNPITIKQLDELYKMTNSYEALFNKRAKKYKAMDLKNQPLSEKDYKQLLLEEYTFLKRPVIVYNDAVFVGNSKKTIENMLTSLKNDLTNEK
jgi:arsenate reductase